MIRTVNLDTADYTNHYQTVTEGPLAVVIYGNEWDGHRYAYGYTILWDGLPMFDGSGYVPSSGVYPDALPAVAEVLSFFTCTDSEQAEEWTEAQVAFVQQYGDVLADLVERIEGGEVEENAKDNY